MLNNQVKFKQGKTSELPQSDIETGAIYLAKLLAENGKYTNASLYYGEDGQTLVPINLFDLINLSNKVNFQYNEDDKCVDIVFI